MKPLRSLASYFCWTRYDYTDESHRVGGVIDFPAGLTSAFQMLVVTAERDKVGVSISALDTSNLRRLSTLGPFYMTIRL